LTIVGKNKERKKYESARNFVNPQFKLLPTLAPTSLTTSPTETDRHLI